MPTGGTARTGRLPGRLSGRRAGCRPAAAGSSVCGHTSFRCVVGSPASTKMRGAGRELTVADVPGFAASVISSIVAIWWDIIVTEKNSLSSFLRSCRPCAGNEGG